MTDVVSFRPTAEELEAIERTRIACGLATRADAVRELVRLGAARTGSLVDEPVFRVRIEGARRKPKGYSSRDIDEALYGGR